MNLFVLQRTKLNSVIKILKLKFWILYIFKKIPLNNFFSWTSSDDSLSFTLYEE